MADPKGFLPDDYLERRLQRRTNVICLSLFVLVLGGITAAWSVGGRQTRDTQRLQEQVNHEFEEAAKRLDQLEVLQKNKEQIMRKAQVTAALPEPVPRSVLLSELIDCMPAAVTLTELTLDSRPGSKHQPQPVATALDQARAKSLATGKAAPPPEPEAPKLDVSLQLFGVAPTDVEVAQFMSALGRSALFSDVVLVFSEQTTVEEQTMRRFRVDMTLNQDLDMSKFEPSVAHKALRNDPMGMAHGPVQITPDGQARPLRDGAPLPATAGVTPGRE